VREKRPEVSAVHNPGKIHWWRVLIGAIFVEASLMLTVPVMLASMEAFFLIVAPARLAVSFLWAYWVGRRITSRFILHGTLVGVVATVFYFGLGFSLMGSIQPLIDIYGPLLFSVANGSRILGAVVGGIAAKKRFSLSSARTGTNEPSGV
jgi:hypothetical protein